jgi:molecular chaperone GrpE
MGETVEIPISANRSSDLRPDHQSPIDGNPAGRVDSPQPVEQLGANIGRLERENDALKKALRDLKQDFQRVREHEKQEQLAARRAGEELAVTALLPAVEALLRASEQLAGREPVLANGIKLLREKVEAALTSAGFTLLGTVGEPFDPQRHEAVTVIGKGGRETVARVLVPGVARDEQVVVPARVIVGRSAHGESFS